MCYLFVCHFASGGVGGVGDGCQEKFINHCFKLFPLNQYSFPFSHPLPSSSFPSPSLTNTSLHTPPYPFLPFFTPPFLSILHFRCLHYPFFSLPFPSLLSFSSHLLSLPFSLLTSSSFSPSLSFPSFWIFFSSSFYLPLHRLPHTPFCLPFSSLFFYPFSFPSSNIYFLYSHPRPSSCPFLLFLSFPFP